MILRNARIVTLDPENRVLDSGAVQILPDGSLGWVEERARLDPAQLRDEQVVDAHGMLLMPALINCHTHLYATFARGLHLPGPAPKNFPEILEKLWWRLDRALNEEDIYYSALMGLIDSAKSGVGMLVDHHSSPNACPYSLDRIEQAFWEVGLRGALCYETSDRNGERGALEAIAENVRFLERKRQPSRDGLVTASFGLHASFTLSDRTLRRAVEASQSFEAGFHVHVAEDRCDLDDCVRRHHGASPVRRLIAMKALNERSLAAHCVHAAPADMADLARHHVNVVHNPQSNCDNAVGSACLPELIKKGVLVGLGSDGYTPRMWEELNTAAHVQRLRSADPRVGYPEAYAAALLNNREIVRKIWGLEVGRIAPGARADLMLVEYYPPTPLHAGNLMGHVLFGIANAPLDTLLVNGRPILRDKHLQTVDEREVAEKASQRARALWGRL